MARKNKQNPTPEAIVEQTPETPTPAKLSAKGLPCLCGCGEETQTPAARFRSGHDAKLRKLVLDAGAAWETVPEIARPFFLQDGTVAGLEIDSTTNPQWLLDAKAERKRRLNAAQIEAEVARRMAEVA